MHETSAAKQSQGLLNHAAGLVAEDIVAEKYRKCGFELMAARKRLSSGEIDVIARHNGKYYFVEVKRAATLEMAAERITLHQQSRIRNAAIEYLAQTGLPLDTDMRFDAALVDHHGRMQIIPNAF